jgi:hypothetical protein
MMKRILLGLLAWLSLAVPTLAPAQTLFTAPPNNGSGGVFLNLQPVNSSLRIVAFEVPFNVPVPGTPVAVEVWTRSGSYVGFTDSNAGWTLTQTVAGVAPNVDVPAPISLTTPINLLPTEITAVYLHSITVGAGIRYTGVGGSPPQTSWSNADLELFSDTARTGNVSFAGGLNTPRTFSGAVRYSKSLETAPSNNGSGGVFLNLLPVNQNLVFQGFDVPLGPVSGTVVTVQVWTRPGSYVGFTDSDAGWTLTQTITGVAQGTTTPAPFVLTTPIGLSLSDITAVYLQAILPAASGSGIRYTGISAEPPQTAWSNADLLLFSDTARTGFAPFGGGANVPRTFSGVVHYSYDALFANGFEN